ncbi:MAG: PAS domain-containing protein, partial [Acidobacteriota bacterium]
MERAHPPPHREDETPQPRGPLGDLEFLRDLLDGLPVDVLVLDREGRFEYANRSAIEDPELRRWVIGRTERELAERRGSSSLLGIERRLQAFERASSTGRLVSYEEEGLHSGNEGRHFLRRLTPVQGASGRTERVFAYGVEITDRVRAEQALARSERHYRRLFDQSRDAVLFTDLEGRLLDANPAAVALVSFESREELLAADLEADLLVEASDRQKILARVAGRGSTDFETRLKTRSGEERTVNGTLSVARDENRRASGFLVVLRDVTDQRRLEEQLRQAQKMEAVGRLAGGIAHDFNNVLTAIQGYCDLLRNEVTDSVARTYAGEIAASAGRAAELTTKLLALGRRQGHDLLEVISINSRVWELEGLLERVIGEDVELEVDVAADAGCVRVDPSELDQALL